MDKRNVALLLFDEIEVLDFAGPFEVFSVTNELAAYRLMHVYTVARRKQPIRARNGLSVNPDYSLAEAPTPDVLILPGGDGTRLLLQQQEVLAWIRASAAQAEKVLTVCTGALLLAEAGLLTGCRATTHHSAFAELTRRAPQTEIVRGSRFVDNGQIITSGGISAGIDMSFHVIECLYGKKAADDTAAYMEYQRLAV